MADEQAQANPPAEDMTVLAEWRVKEYEKHERGRAWYIVAITTALLLLLFSFLTANFLFAVIIVVSALIFILHEGGQPMQVSVVLTDEGIIVGKRFYDYDDIKNFSIVYKPSQNIKNLYLNFHNPLRHRLSISLENMNPLHIREILLKYLSEDLDQTDPPLSDELSRLLKI